MVNPSSRRNNHKDPFLFVVVHSIPLNERGLARFARHVDTLVTGFLVLQVCGLLSLVVPILSVFREAHIKFRCLFC